MQEFYTQGELVKELHCNSRTIGKLRQFGLLKAIRVGKCYIYRQSDIEEFWRINRGRDMSNEEMMLLATKKALAGTSAKKHE